MSNKQGSNVVSITGIIDAKHQKEVDEFIRNYCKENNIEILEISYTNSDDK